MAVEVLCDMHVLAWAHGFRGTFPNPPNASRFFQALGSWDAAWYTSIAKHGYFWSEPQTPFGNTPLGHPVSHHLIGDQASIAFYPAWADILRAVSWTFGGENILIVGAAVTFLLGAAATVAMWYLVRHLAGPAVADRAVALWVFFPGSFVLTMIYAEGLTVLCASICILALFKRRWVIAGLAAGVATANQPDALTLIGVCSWAAGRAMLRGAGLEATVKAYSNWCWAFLTKKLRSLPVLRNNLNPAPAVPQMPRWPQASESRLQMLLRSGEWRALIAPVLSLAGVFGYFLYLYVTTGDFLRWLHVEQTIWSGGGMAHGLYWNFIHHPLFAFQHMQVLEDVAPALGLLWIIIGAVFLVKWRPPVEFWLFGAGVVLVSMASASVGARPRLLLAAFPLVVAVAKYAKGRMYHVVLAGSSVLLALVTIVTLNIGLVYGGNFIVP